jgi:hypothetical protein
MRIVSAAILLEGVGGAGGGAAGDGCANRLIALDGGDGLEGGARVTFKSCPDDFGICALR